MSIIHIAAPARSTLHPQAAELRYASDRIHYLDNLRALAMLVETPLVLGVKLLLTSGGTFLFCFATYVVFVRYTPIGWMLNGQQAFP
jgi:hypothetical protein